MSARTRLNVAYATGSVIVAGLAGGVTQSWPVFAVALGLMLFSNVWLNEIRLKQPSRGHGRKRTHDGADR